MRMVHRWQISPCTLAPAELATNARQEGSGASAEPMYLDTLINHHLFSQTCTTSSHRCEYLRNLTKSAAPSLPFPLNQHHHHMPNSFRSVLAGSRSGLWRIVGILRVYSPAGALLDGPVGFDRAPWRPRESLNKVQALVLQSIV